MTEDDIRRIVREEIERAKPMTHHRGIPLPPNSPVVDGWPVRQLPMPTYKYQDIDLSAAVSSSCKPDLKRA